jgi:hypothetical protein
LHLRKNRKTCVKLAQDIIFPHNMSSSINKIITIIASRWIDMRIFIRQKLSIFIFPGLMNYISWIETSVTISFYGMSMTIFVIVVKVFSYCELEIFIVNPVQKQNSTCISMQISKPQSVTEFKRRLSSVVVVQYNVFLLKYFPNTADGPQPYI